MKRVCKKCLGDNGALTIGDPIPWHVIPCASCGLDIEHPSDGAAVDDSTFYDHIMDDPDELDDPDEEEEGDYFDDDEAVEYDDDEEDIEPNW